MNIPNIPKWQTIAVPTVFVMLCIFYFAKYFVADELIYANYEVEALRKDLESSLELLEAEKARATVAEREADVVRGANAILRGSERQRQDEMANLQADLAFYRRLGGANGTQAPLAVHYLELQSTQSPRVYRIIFTLTQNLRWAAVVSGQIHLGVDGIRNGVAQHLTEELLLAESAEPLKFQFKYFQQLERLITLPEGFEASQLTIRLRTGSLRAAVEQSMEWSSLFNKNDTQNGEDKTPVSSPDD
ncbi:MAG: hypothetical protein GQ538_03170 [Xanthomonadales bacterium]|nr:hypothetical protein [Xanthomonadales bacterium]